MSLLINIVLIALLAYIAYKFILYAFMGGIYFVYLIATSSYPAEGLTALALLYIVSAEIYDWHYGEAK